MQLLEKFTAVIGIWTDDLPKATCEAARLSDSVARPDIEGCQIITRPRSAVLALRAAGQPLALPAVRGSPKVIASLSARCCITAHASCCQGRQGGIPVPRPGGGPRGQQQEA